MFVSFAVCASQRSTNNGFYLTHFLIWNTSVTPPHNPPPPLGEGACPGRGTSAVIDVHNPPAARPLQTQNPAVLKKTMCSRAAKRNPSAGRRGRRARCSAGLWGLPGFHIREEREGGGETLAWFCLSSFNQSVGGCQEAFSEINCCL